MIRPTAVPMPIGRAYSLRIRPHADAASSAIMRPMASPPNTPVSTPIRVMPICTVDSRLSGCLASSSALLAPRLGASGSSAICFRRSLREVIKAISDSAKKPLTAISSRTMENSSIGSAALARIATLAGAPMHRGARAGRWGRAWQAWGFVHGMRRGAPASYQPARDTARHSRHQTVIIRSCRP